MKHRQSRHRILRTEAIGFSAIIALSWLTELMRLPHLLFEEPFSPNWQRALLRTVVVLAVWVWVYIGTRQLLQRLHYLEDFLLICSWCRKIGHEGEWVTMEKYFGSQFRTRTTHGMCPECAATMLAGISPVSPDDKDRAGDPGAAPPG
jgi:hypothetical protein